jgi:ribosomal protein S18 acetylase RimI-like enzyme
VKAIERVGVRPAKPHERQEVERTVRACGKWVRTYFDMRNLPELYERGCVWIATEDGAIAAFAVAVPLKRSDVTSLYEFGVHPEWRRVGVGRALLKVCAQGRPLKMVVDAENGQAALFYMKCGLRITGRHIVKTGLREVFALEGKPCA